MLLAAPVVSSWLFPPPPLPPPVITPGALLPLPLPPPPPPAGSSSGTLLPTPISPSRFAMYVWNRSERGRSSPLAPGAISTKRKFGSVAPSVHMPFGRSTCDSSEVTVAVSLVVTLSASPLAEQFWASQSAASVDQRAALSDRIFSSVAVAAPVARHIVAVVASRRCP